MSTRREFLRSLSLISAGLFLASASCKTRRQQPEKKQALGIQLYSLRDVIWNDLHATMAGVSSIGFTGVEAYGFDGHTFFGMEARAFKQLCDDLALEIYSTHTGITEQNAAVFAETAADIGMKYLVLPSFGGRPHNTISDYQMAAEEMNRMGEICKSFGVRFGYHNHDFEFKKIGEVMPYDILLKETEPDLVTFQADTYFFAKSGLDPVHFFKTYPGRFESLHLKDLAMDGESCIIGNGIVDFEAVLASAGATLLIYEQEQCAEGSSLYCAEQSIRYIHSHLLKH